MGACVSNDKWHRMFHLTCNEVGADEDTYQQILPVWTVAVTNNMKQLAYATGDHKINLSCLITHQLLISLTGHADTIWKIAYSPDDTILASTSADGTVRLWEVGTGMPVMILPRCHANWAKSLAWSPEGDKLVTAGSDTRILVWSTAKACDRARRCAFWRAESDHPAAKKRHEALLQLQGAPEPEDVEYELSQPLLAWQAHEKGLSGIAFAPKDARMLASCGTEGTIAVWDSETGALDCRLMGHIGPITCIDVSPLTDELMATGGEDHTVRLWDLADIAPGSMAAKASREKSIGYNLAHFTLKGHEGGVNAVKFCMDGQLLASASKDCEVRIWNPSRKSPTLNAKFTAHEAWVLDLAWKHDQELLFSGSTDGLVFAWHVPNKYHTHAKGRDHGKKPAASGAPKH